MGSMNRDFSIPIDIISIHYIFINKKSIGESYRQKVIKVKWSKCQLKLKHKASAVLFLYSLSFHLSVNHADNYSSSPHAEINHCWSIKTKWLPFSSPSVSEWMGHLIFIYHVPLSNGRSVMCTGLTYPMRFKVTLMFGSWHILRRPPGLSEGFGESIVVSASFYLTLFRNLTGGTVVQWLAMPPHSKKILFLNLAANWSHPVWTVHVLHIPFTVQRHVDYINWLL